MLKCLVECKLPAKFLIIEDKEDVCCKDLFKAFLNNFKFQNPVKKVNLICYENPPEFYLSSNKFTDKEITSYNYFSDPVGWKNSSTPKTDLSVFTSLDSQDLSETVFFIDSISLLVYYHGFSVAYSNLCVLKKLSYKIVCVVNGDVLMPEQLDELYFLAAAIIKVSDFSSKDKCTERVCEVIFKKPRGKVLKQEESFTVSDDFVVSSSVKEAEKMALPKEKADMENLTTFNLGIHMSEGEKKAKEELVLPYVKTQRQNRTGVIIYQREADEMVDDPDEMEDDPDDDLDI